MRELTRDEIGYLRIMHNNGFKYIATDENNKTFLHQDKPQKGYLQWLSSSRITELRIDNFGTDWLDEEPTSIAELLSIDETDWSKVKPFTPIWVRNHKCDEWTRAYFIKENQLSPYPYTVNLFGYWKYQDAGTVTYKYCRIATQEEIKGVMNEL